MKPIHTLISYLPYQCKVHVFVWETMEINKNVRLHTGKGEGHSAPNASQHDCYVNCEGWEGSSGEQEATIGGKQTKNNSKHFC